MPNPLIALSSALFVIALLAFFFWPQRGLVPRWNQARSATERVLTEDALKHLYFCEMNNERVTIQSTAGKLQVSENKAAALLESMQARDLVELNGGALRLTPAGHEYALHIIRAHRLWERYLADETGYGETQWHDQAEQVEHELSPVEIDQLAAQLGNPTHDPHGDPIPTSDGWIVNQHGLPLTIMEAGQVARITHLEDEPDAVYAQLAAEGLYPGMEVHILEVSPQRVRFWADGDEHVLAPIVAANISVQLLPKEIPMEPGWTLADLKPGEKGKVTTLSPRCRGAERRRLLDLGIVPGTVIEAEMVSPGGDPTAYLVRDTLIALRKEQAELINIEPMTEAVQEVPA
jgi:DtxR family Mn-dependent transcriptional regulator